MKIALLQRRPFPGQFSVEGYFGRLADDLRLMGHEVQPCILPHLSLGVLPRVRNMLHARRIQGDIVHITGDVHYTALGCEPSRTVLTILDCATLERLRGMRLRIFRYFWFTMPMRRCAAISVISHETKRVLLEKFPAFDENKVRVIYVSISDRFQFSPREFQSDCPRILQVGTKGNKNLDRLFRALQGIRCKLIIVGELTSDECQFLRRLGIDYENPKGLTDSQLVEEYRNCDMVSFASTMEGFGMPIVEGQVTGRPVLTANVSSMPEVAGRGACLVDPYDVGSIRRGFEAIVGSSEYREELIRAGRENSKRFHSRAIATEFAKLYSEILEASSA